jgi:hypothetical protein
MVSNPCIEIQTTSDNRPSVPAWFAEVVIIAGHLAKKGLLEAFAHQVRLVRRRFGKYEPIDFLVLLVGHAIRGERTLADFFERLAPFEEAFMALFGRRCLPHRSSLSRFLADVDRPCLEAFRALFQQHSFIDGWTQESIGGLWDRKARRYIVFDVDATRQAAGNERSRAILRCLLQHADSTRSVHPATPGASEGKWFAHELPRFKCTPTNGSAPTPVAAMATLVRSSAQLCKPSSPI